MTDLVPSLDGSSNRVEKYGVVQRPRMPPLVSNLLSQSLLLLLVELLDSLKLSWILGYKGPRSKKRQGVFGHPFLPLELGNILEELVAGDAFEGIADFAGHVLGELGNLIVEGFSCPASW